MVNIQMTCLVIKKEILEEISKKFKILQKNHRFHLFIDFWVVLEAQKNIRNLSKLVYKIDKE